MPAPRYMVLPTTCHAANAIKSERCSETYHWRRRMTLRSLALCNHSADGCHVHLPGKACNFQLCLLVWSQHLPMRTSIVIDVVTLLTQ